MNRRAAEAALTERKTDEAREAMRLGLPTIEAARPMFCGLLHASPLVAHLADVWDFDRHGPMLLAVLRDDAPAEVRKALRDDLAAAIGESVACGICDDADEIAAEYGEAA